jgi:hypothetical protein
MQANAGYPTNSEAMQVQALIEDLKRQKQAEKMRKTASVGFTSSSLNRTNIGKWSTLNAGAIDYSSQYTESRKFR